MFNIFSRTVPRVFLTSFTAAQTSGRSEYNRKLNVLISAEIRDQKVTVQTFLLAGKNWLANPLAKYKWCSVKKWAIKKGPDSSCRFLQSLMLVSPSPI